MVDEVSKLLKTLKVNKATGPDKLPNVVLKKCADALAPSLTFLINLARRRRRRILYLSTVVSSGISIIIN